MNIISHDVSADTAPPQTTIRKIPKMAEPAWLIGTILCAFGVVLCTKASFGLSMMAAPPYIIHVAVSEFLPWYTQGTSEYVWQAALLLLMCLLVKGFKLRYLLSFATAVFFGLAIDGWLCIFGGSRQFHSLPLRILAFAIGLPCISLSVAFVFRTYLPAQIAEYLVMEVARHYGMKQTKVKQINDITCLLLSFGLSFLLTGEFTGVGLGTIVISLTNASIIGFWGRVLDRVFDFGPMFPRLKSFFEA